MPTLSREELIDAFGCHYVYLRRSIENSSSIHYFREVAGDPPRDAQSSDKYFSDLDEARALVRKESERIRDSHYALTRVALDELTHPSSPWPPGSHVHETNKPKLVADLERFSQQNWQGPRVVVDLLEGQELPYLLTHGQKVWIISWKSGDTRGGKNSPLVAIEESEIVRRRLQRPVNNETLRATLHPLYDTRCGRTFFYGHGNPGKKPMATAAGIDVFLSEEEVIEAANEIVERLKVSLDGIASFLEKDCATLKLAS